MSSITICCTPGDPNSLMEIFPDGRMEFSEYDIESDIIAVELGDDPSPAWELYKEYQEYGILVFAATRERFEMLDPDLLDGLLDITKREWLLAICKNLDGFISDNKYDAPAYLHWEDIMSYTSEIIKYFDGWIEMKQQPECFYEGPEGMRGYNRYAAFTVTTDLVLNYLGVDGPDTIGKCLDFDAYVFGSYGRAGATSYPGEDREWGEWIENYDSYMGLIDALAKEFNTDIEEAIDDVPEAYTFMEQFKQYGPFDRYPGGRWALVINGDTSIIFTGVYRDEKSLREAVDYIQEWFCMSQYHNLSFKIYRATGKHEEFHAEINRDLPCKEDVSDGWELMERLILCPCV